MKSEKVLLYDTIIQMVRRWPLSQGDKVNFAASKDVARNVISCNGIDTFFICPFIHRENIHPCAVKILRDYSAISVPLID